MPLAFIAFFTSTMFLATPSAASDGVPVAEDREEARISRPNFTVDISDRRLTASDVDRVAGGPNGGMNLRNAASRSAGSASGEFVVDAGVRQQHAEPPAR